MQRVGLRGLPSVLLIAMSVGGSGSVPCLAASTVPVVISVHARIDGQTLRVFGKATVPDGAWIIYAAYRTAAPKRRAKGYAQVRDDRFAALVNIAGWPPGTIKVDANFQVLLPTRVQPATVTARFGAHGERMTGPDVVKGGDSFRAAVGSTTIVKP